MSLITSFYNVVTAALGILDGLNSLHGTLTKKDTGSNLRRQTLLPHNLKPINKMSSIKKWMYS